MTTYEFFVQLVFEVVKAGTIATALMLGFAAMTWVERRLVSRFTLRLGPNRVGPAGLLQPIADMFKMFFKEEMVPGHVDRWIYIIAPGMSLVPALMIFAVIPIAGQGFEIPFFGGATIQVSPWIADINVGVLYILAIGSLGTYGVILGGWASNNKYSLLGGLRTSAQMLSYELPMGLAVLALVMITGTMSVVEMTQIQSNFFGLGWFVFIQPIGFIIFFISGLAEAGRAPFDLPETENELVGGFVTEYGGMKFGLFFGAEYVHTIVFAALAATLYLGGWAGPFVHQVPILGVFYFLGKVGAMLFVIIWIRASIPRMRFDQLMRFCWKLLIPLALLNLAITAVVALGGAQILGFF